MYHLLSISSYFCRSTFNSLYFLYSPSIGAMSLTYRILRWLFLSNYCWYVSIFQRSSLLSDFILAIIASIFSCDISYPPLLVSASFSFLQQTQSGRNGSFSSWLGCFLKLLQKSLSQFFSSFLTFFFQLASPSTVIESIYCSSSTFLLLFINVSSSPNFLKASFSRFGASLSIHSATFLYLITSGLLVEDSLDASLSIENESFCGLMLLFLELFSCLMSPYNSLTLGLHQMVSDSLLLNKSETVDVTSQLRMSNSIQNLLSQYHQMTPISSWGYLYKCAYDEGYLIEGSRVLQSKQIDQS